MAVPSHSSAIGVLGKAAVAVAKSSVVAFCAASAPPSTTKHSRTPGQDLSASIATSSLLRDVISTWLSLFTKI